MTTPRRPGAPRMSPGASGARANPRPAQPGTAPSPELRTQPRHRPPAASAARPGRPPAQSAPARRASSAEPDLRVRPRGPRGSWAGSISWRAVVVLVVVVLAVATVAPTVRAYLHQREELADLRAERDAAQAEIEDLTAEVARWDDPHYVQAQARERLAYVFPGEVPFRVIDPHVVAVAPEGSLAAQQATTGENAAPWFEQMSQSLLDVGDPPPPVTAVAPEDDGPVEVLTDIDFGG